MNHPTHPSARLLAVAVWATLALTFGAAHAGLADISNVPLGTSSVNAKPNIMFILDDSGSMASEYMPDDMSSTSRYGYKSPHCNGLWFNPTMDYPAPVQVASDGAVTTYPNASFIAAWKNGYNPSNDPDQITNLSGGGYYAYTGSQPDMAWTYNADGSLASSTFVTECRTGTSSTGPFTWTPITAELQQKYANWYSYYRTRLQLMRTAVGRAFKDLDADYRVGFTMISDRTVTSGDFLGIADFDSTQKYSFYNKLYNSYSGSYTPLRGALSKVGQYYGKVAANQPADADPIQYSCQRNYAILSTDGYWNTETERTTAPTYGPYKLDRVSTVGQQDGNEARPMKDGASDLSTLETRDPFETITTTVTPVTTTYSGRQYQVDTAARTNGCSSGQYYTRRKSASCAVTWDQTTTSTRTETTVTRVVTRNGVPGSPTSSTEVSTVSVNNPTTAPDCPTANWSTSGGWSDRCYSLDDLTSRDLTPGFNGYVATSSSNSQGAVTSTSSTTNDPPATTTTTITSSGGASNSLADVAEYYYRTDLRTDLENTVKAVPTDPATHQHMNTYTVGLGVKGTLAYTVDYLTSPTSSDYAALVAGTKNWPTPSGTLGGSENATHVDDLWHAAVNGRGRYFSATNSATLSSSLATTLGEITAQSGSAAAAAGSSLKPTESDGWMFLPSYTTHSETSSWFGDLRAFKRRFAGGKALAPDTSSGAELWSARTRLESRTSARRILFRDGTSLVSFTYSNLTSAGLNGSFDNRCTTASPTLSQCGSLSAAAKAKVTGENLVNYLTGDKTLYLNNSSQDNQVFRTRTNRLGDIVNSSPAYMAKPPFRYADSGYSSFITAKANRTPVVFVGANDGMLHAFKVGLTVDSSNNAVVASDAGEELWAFVPSTLIPNLWRLADQGFDADHRFYVDATPVIADVYDATAAAWKTILVGGLGRGGSAYYALDVTDPVNPVFLWEFTDTNLGFTYGNPIVTKNAAGTWVVMFSSGINNNAGNGKGRLYIRNAITGAAENGGYIETSVGTASTPSNLTRIDAWIDTTTNNTALRVYGGDMQGNLWRFDIDNRIPPAGNEATLLGIAQAPDGNVQPITAKPLLSEISVDNTRYPLVTIATGRYLGTNDLGDATVQSVYTVKDSLASTGLGVLRNSDALLVQQTLGSDRFMTSPQTVNWASKNGWFVDLTISSRERVFVDPITTDANVIEVASAIPGSDVCVPGGPSYDYEFNLLYGTVSRVTRFNTMIVGLGAEQHPDGSRGSVVTGLDGSITARTDGALPSTGAGALRRSSWRELID